MRPTVWRVVPAALLLCVAILHLHTSGSSSGSDLTAAAGPVAFRSGFAHAQLSGPSINDSRACTAAQHAERDADASAFDDDDDLPMTEDAEEVQAAPTDAVPTPATAGRTAAAPAATAAADLDDDEVADLLADDDEFVGAEPVAAPVKAKAKAKPIQKKKKAKKGAAPAAPAADPSEATIGNVVNAPQSFFQPIGVYEYVGAALVLLYILNYLYGSRANRRVAREWEAAFVPLLQEQFALVGADMDGAAAAAGQPLLQKESESVYKLYASGRRYAESALVTLDLVARQDLISLGLGLADLAQRRDTMTIDVPLDDEACPAMVFALLRKKGAKKAIKGQADLEAITQPKGPRVPALDKYVVLSELGAEVELELLPERVVKMLQRPSVEAHLHSIHVSDQLSVPFSLSTKILRCKFSLPDEWKSRGEESAVEAVQSLTNMAFFMVDRVGEIKLSPAARARSELKRKKLAEQQHKASAKERQEAMLKRKEDLRKKEADIIASDPHSELARELIRKKEIREAKQIKKQKGSNIKVMR